MEKMEMLARAWIECDPNRGGELGSGWHADDIMPPNEDSQGNITHTELTGKPQWHWFMPRAEALDTYIASNGFKLVAVE